MSSALRLRRFRRLGLSALGARERWSFRARWGAALGLFVVALGVRSLHAVDLAPAMDTAAQPGMRMTRRYDIHAVEMLQGAGLVFPRDADPADTGLASRPPGYSILLAGLYALLGRGLSLTQLAQNLANSLTPILVLLLGARAISWRVGFVAGVLVAVTPHFAYYSNLILPDALCVLPVLVGSLFLVRGRRGKRSVAWCAAAGGVFGLATWLRPNMLVLAPFVGAGLILLSPRRASLAKAAAMTLASCAAIAPITLRNYLVYGEFVPVSSNSGIVLWEGIADAGGERFGAVPTDGEVERQEARLYGNPRYRSWWASPDGIWRDRERIHRGLAVIRAHPVWFAGAMLRRAGDLLDYAASAPPLVATRAQNAVSPVAETVEDAKLGSGAGPLSARWNSPEAVAALTPLLPREACLAFGRALGPGRPAVRAAQGLLRLTMLPALLAGVAGLALLSLRRALFLALVPLCFLLFQTAVHLEFRMTLTMHAVLSLFIATGFVLIVWFAAKRSRGFAA